jgi:hypothetical protein
VVNWLWTTSRTIAVVSFRSKSACFFGDLGFWACFVWGVRVCVCLNFVNVGVLGFFEGKKLSFGTNSWWVGREFGFWGS